MKFKALTAQIPDIEDDYARAAKFERWRIGSRAMYVPGGFNTAAYLPLEEIRSAYPHDFRLKGGCSCAGTIFTGGLVVRYGENEVIKIIPGNEKYAARILDALKEKLPGLDTEIPDIYKNRTREQI